MSEKKMLHNAFNNIAAGGYGNTCGTHSLSCVVLVAQKLYHFGIFDRTMKKIRFSYSTCAFLVGYIL